MNFICEKCKQKYHVADEKLQGRAVTRFRCKKCDHIIELEAPTQTALGGSSSATSSSAPASVRPATMAVPAVRSGAPVKARPATTSGPAFGTTPARAATLATPAARSAASSNLSARPTPGDRGWYAGIRDVPVGPLTRAELGARVQSGDVAADTLVWREGLDDWRPLQNIAELSDLLRPAPAASGPAEAARPGSSANAAARNSRPAVVDDDEEATRVSGLDPSLAGIMGKRPRPDKPEAPKPAGAALSPLARTSAPRPPAAPDRRDLSPTPARAPEPASAVTSAPPAAVTSAPPAAVTSAPPSAVTSTPPVARAPGGESSTASKRPAAEVSSSEKRPTGEPSTSEKRPTGEPSSSEKRPGSEPSFSEKRPEDELLDELFAKPAKANSGPSQRPPVESSPLFTPPSSPVAPPPSAPPSTPPPPTVLAAPTLPDPSPLATPPVPSLAPLLGPAPTPAPPPPVAAPPVVAPAPPPAPRALPPVVWLMMAGVLVAGLLGGLYIGRMNAPRPEATPAPPRPALPAPVPQLAGPDAGADVAVAAPRGEAPPGAAVQQTAMALAPASTRADALVRAFQESNLARTCWQSTVAQRPDLAATSVTIDLHADARGRLASLDVAQSPDPRFDACLRGRLGTVAAIGDGEAVDARATVSLAVAP